MPVTAKLRYLRIAPRKVRLGADLIRKKPVEEAQTVLNFTIKKAAPVLLKLLKSAIASAKNLGFEEKNLYISKITVDEGPKYKRQMPRARGMASEIQKKTSHITLVLDQIKPVKIKKIKEVKKEKELSEMKKEKTELQKPKLKPEKEITKLRPEKGIKRIFRRKAF